MTYNTKTDYVPKLDLDQARVDAGIQREIAYQIKTNGFTVEKVEDIVKAKNLFEKPVPTL